MKATDTEVIEVHDNTEQVFQEHNDPKLLKDEFCCDDTYEKSSDKDLVEKLLVTQEEGSCLEWRQPSQSCPRKTWRFSNQRYWCSQKWWRKPINPIRADVWELHRGLKSDFIDS